MATHQELLVYEGLGAEPNCVEYLSACLRDWAGSGSNTYVVKTITPEEILKGNWTEKAALIAFPGGYDSGFLKTLGEEGQALIREYVHNGGSYLGMCAGGYFGSAYIEFDKGGPLEVVGPREMEFYPGTCEGPAFPGFQYGSTEGAYAVSLKFEKEEENFHSYFNGGGLYVMDGSLDDVDVIARYEDLEGQPPAIVKCRAGRGQAVLSGAHWEFRGADLNPNDPNLKDIIPLLLASEEKRRNFVSSVMELLELRK